MVLKHDINYAPKAPESLLSDLAELACCGSCCFSITQPAWWWWWQARIARQEVPGCCFCCAS